jgi:peptidoglycan/LPS O-acetylase OafA/YrhL
MRHKLARRAGSLKNLIAKSISPYVNSSFQALLLAFLLLLLINEFYKVKFINMTIMLIIVVVFGIISILLPSEPEKKHAKRTIYDDVLVYIIGIIGGVIVFLKTREMGWLSYVIAVVTFLLVVLLGSIIYDESEDKAK